VPDEQDDEHLARHIAIIGGGFSGTLVAANLVRHSGLTPLHVSILEPRPTLGLGVAYSTTCPLHLLNVAAGRMSVWPDQPNHFLEWAQRRLPFATTHDYLPRPLYGEYVRETMMSIMAGRPSNVSWEHVRARCSQFSSATGGAVTLQMDQGSDLRADRVVLTTGNFPPADPLPELAQSSRYFRNPWQGLADIPSRLPVLLIGTGLTMVDTVLELLSRNHSGPIHAVSRHGLLPNSHLRLPNAVASTIAPAELGRGVRAALRVVRRMARN
jgi:uncharacterized NAD(P)/FAD-binding protein YdhS